jgi:hypothetical protein
MADGVAAPAGSMLRGRRDECAVFDGLLDGTRAGRSGALVVRGDAGVGKTVLLDYAIASASDLGVVHAVGVESEMELAFAALHQLCVPMLDRLERLPGPQRVALVVTFGLSEGPVPDRFLVGLAALGLLSEAAEERALVCVVDDAQNLRAHIANLRRKLSLTRSGGPIHTYAGVGYLLEDVDTHAPQVTRTRPSSRTLSVVRQS